MDSEFINGYYQLCPMCNGEGRVNNVGTTTSISKVCPVCDGGRVIYHAPKKICDHIRESDGTVCVGGRCSKCGEIVQ